VTHSCNHCFSGNADRIKYYECVSVFLPWILGTQNNIFYVSYYIVISGLSGCTIFFHITSQMARFSQKHYWTETCVLIFSTAFVQNISFYEEFNKILQIRIGHRVKYLLVLSDFNQTWSSWQIFKQSSHQISWRSVQWEVCHSTQTDRQTLLRVAFHNVANTPKNWTSVW
jgi:hypothetical protein